MERNGEIWKSHWVRSQVIDGGAGNLDLQPLIGKLSWEGSKVLTLIPASNCKDPQHNIELNNFSAWFNENEYSKCIRQGYKFARFIFSRWQDYQLLAPASHLHYHVFSLVCPHHNTTNNEQHCMGDGIFLHNILKDVHKAVAKVLWISIWFLKFERKTNGGAHYSF